MEGINMLTHEIKKVIDTWPAIADIVFVPHTEQEYNQIVDLLDKLIDEVGENEDHPLASLMDLVGTLIEKYEAEHVPEISANL